MYRVERERERDRENQNTDKSENLIVYINDRSKSITRQSNHVRIFNPVIDNPASSFTASSKKNCLCQTKNLIFYKYKYEYTLGTFGLVSEDQQLW